MTPGYAPSVTLTPWLLTTDSTLAPLRFDTVRRMATKRVKVCGTVLGYRAGDEALVDTDDDEVAAAIESGHMEVLGNPRKGDAEPVHPAPPKQD